MKLVYLVDDNLDTHQIMKIWLHKRDYEVRGFINSTSFFNAMSSITPDVVLMDVHIGLEDGRDICREMRKRFSKHIPVIMFSMIYDDIQEVEESCADDTIRRNATLQEITELLGKYVQLEMPGAMQKTVS